MPSLMHQTADCRLPTAGPARSADPGALTLFVCGLGRCGTTLVMRMLAAGGAPVAGEAPTFERYTHNELAAPATLAEVRGRAVKVLDPQRLGFFHPLFDLRPRHAILLSRDTAEQAKSQIHFVRSLQEAVSVEAGAGPRLYTGAQPGNRGMRRTLTARLIRDQKAAQDTLRRAGVPITPLAFERILAEPQAMAERIAFQLRPWWRLDAAAMAATVIRRDPAWSGTLDLEAAEAFAKEAGL